MFYSGQCFFIKKNMIFIFNYASLVLWHEDTLWSAMPLHGRTNQKQHCSPAMLRTTVALYCMMAFLTVIFESQVVRIHNILLCINSIKNAFDK